MQSVSTAGCGRHLPRRQIKAGRQQGYSLRTTRQQSQIHVMARLRLWTARLSNGRAPVVIVKKLSQEELANQSCENAEARVVAAYRLCIARQLLVALLSQALLVP